MFSRLLTNGPLKQALVQVGKSSALDTGKKLPEKGVTMALIPKLQVIFHESVGVPKPKISPDAVEKKTQSSLVKYLIGIISL